MQGGEGSEGLKRGKEGALWDWENIMNNSKYSAVNPMHVFVFVAENIVFRFQAALI